LPHRYCLLEKGGGGKAAGGFLFILLLIPFLATAQVKENVLSPEMYHNETPGRFTPMFHINTGSNFMFMPGFGNGMNFYVNPSVTMPVTKKLFVEGGIVASSSMMPGRFPFQPENGNRNFNNLTIYGSTMYQLSPRLMIYGSGVKSIVSRELPMPDFYRPGNSFTLGSSFKLSSNITIGAAVHVSDYNYFYNPFRSAEGYPLW
jgi:hypothetical protein